MRGTDVTSRAHVQFYSCEHGRPMQRATASAYSLLVPEICFKRGWARPNPVKCTLYHSVHGYMLYMVTVDTTRST